LFFKKPVRLRLQSTPFQLASANGAKTPPIGYTERRTSATQWPQNEGIVVTPDIGKGRQQLTFDCLSIMKLM